LNLAVILPSWSWANVVPSHLLFETGAGFTSSVFPSCVCA
jgi:hypothetical protein